VQIYLLSLYYITNKVYAERCGFMYHKLLLYLFCTMSFIQLSEQYTCSPYFCIHSF